MQMHRTLRVRREVNEWFRHSGEFDAIIDFDHLLQDPTHPSRQRPEFDSGDHLHPSDAGYAEMARAAALIAKQTRHAFGKAQAGELDAGVIRVGTAEIVVCDNDPNFAERGVLEIQMEGGK